MRFTVMIDERYVFVLYYLYFNIENKYFKKKEHITCYMNSMSALTPHILWVFRQSISDNDKCALPMEQFHRKRTLATAGLDGCIKSKTL
jgi:hypothetical protein